MRIPWRRAKPTPPAPRLALISADSPEVRLIAKRVGIDPSRLSKGLSDPEHLLAHVAPAELKRYGEGITRILAARPSPERVAVLRASPLIDAAIDIAIAHHRKEKLKEPHSNA